MSWLRDIESDLVNLDHVNKIEILELENPHEGDTHALVARFPQDEEPAVWLFFGTENECRLKLETIAKGLHMVRF